MSLKNTRSKHFNQNLNYGGRAEVRAVQLLKPKYPSIRRIADEIKGTFKDYDLLDDNGITFEVKTDATSKKTGNIAIEYESYGKPSGIASTKAKYWFQYFYSDGWVYTVCNVEDLRDLLMFRGYPTTEGGEDKQSKMYLIPVYEFTDEFGVTGNR